MNDFHRQFPTLTFNPPASADLISKHQKRLNATFPASYQSFLLEANGATGFTNETDEAHYVDLWALDQVDLVEAYEKYQQGIVIGSNGAGEGICLTSMNGRSIYGLLPFIVPIREDFIPVADTLMGFLLCPDWFGRTGMSGGS